jgi:hypothetical protein
VRGELLKEMYYICNVMLNELNDIQGANESQDLGRHKQELEIEKLQREITELKKKWYKKPAYLAFIVPSIILYFNTFLNLRKEQEKGYISTMEDLRKDYQRKFDSLIYLEKRDLITKNEQSKRIIKNYEGFSKLGSFSANHYSPNPTEEPPQLGILQDAFVGRNYHEVIEYCDGDFTVR